MERLKSMKMVCFDVDGTLLAGGHRDLSPDFLHKVSKAKDSGMTLVVSTGRPNLGSGARLAAQLCDSSWHAFHNGALLWSMLHGSVVVGSVEQVRPAVEIGLRFGAGIELYTPDMIVWDPLDHRCAEHVEELQVEPWEQHRCAPELMLELELKVLKVELLVPCCDEQEVLVACLEAGLFAVLGHAPSMPDVGFISILPPGSGKGLALLEQAKLSGVELEHVLMVGDGLNDLCAFRCAGLSAAMATAREEVRSSATLLVPSAEQSGCTQLLDAIQLSRKVPV